MPNPFHTSKPLVLRGASPAHFPSRRLVTPPTDCPDLVHPSWLLELGDFALVPRVSTRPDQIRLDKWSALIDVLGPSFPSLPFQLRIQVKTLPLYRGRRFPTSILCLFWSHLSWRLVGAGRPTWEPLFIFFIIFFAYIFWCCRRLFRDVLAQFVSAIG